MSPEQNLVIRADASTQIGIGHIMRCLALALAWQSHGGKATLLSHCGSEELKQRIESSGIRFIRLSQPHPDPSDLPATLSTLSSVRSGNGPHAMPWLALDGYHFDEGYCQAIKAAEYPLLVLDDMNHRPQYHADVLVNQNINAEQFNYRCDSDTTLLLGTNYVMLRPEFLRWRSWGREIPAVARNVLVMMGGGDPENVTLKVIRALQRMEVEHLEALVLIGASNPHYEELQQELLRTPFVEDCHARPVIRLVRNTANVPELMAWADVAISASGSTSWELAFMGVPSILLVLADNQQGIAGGLNEVGAAINLGWFEHVSIERLAEILGELIKSSDQRQQMNQRGRQLVDGGGVERITRVLRLQAPQYAVGV